MRNESLYTLKSEWPGTLLTASSLLLSAALLKFVALPAWFDYKELGAEISAKSALVTGETGRGEMKAVLTEKRKQLEIKSLEIRSLYGAAENLPELLRIIFDIAKEAGVTVERAQPQNDNDNSRFGGYEIVLEVSGQYNNIFNFTSQIEQIPLCVEIIRMSIENSRENGLSVNFLLRSSFSRKADND